MGADAAVDNLAATMFAGAGHKDGGNFTIHVGGTGAGGEEIANDIL
jgi:hypothetical protein